MMYDSGVSAADLIRVLEQEADIALPISNSNWVLWLNQLEWVLYSEVVREQGRAAAVPDAQRVIKTLELSVGSDQAPVLPEDVYTIYADKVQLIKSTVASGVIFPDTWYIDGKQIRYHTTAVPKILEVIYFVRPACKEVDQDGEITGGNVRVPYGFLDMVRARLRGEAYKLANEDTLAAKWINDYNILLETFKTYVEDRRPQFGM